LNLLAKAIFFSPFFSVSQLKLTAIDILILNKFIDMLLLIAYFSFVVCFINCCLFYQLLSALVQSVETDCN